MGLHFLRSADWLTAARARAYLWILAALNAVTLAMLVATSRGGVDRNGFLLGTDFLSFWTVGRMLGQHADVYDQGAHIAAQQAYFTQADAFTAFFYPPTFLPFCWPLGWLPYFPALALWLVATGALFVFAVLRWLRAHPIAAPAWLLLLAFPASVIQITHGQTAFLSAGSLMLGALWVRGRPALAGVAFGLATIKPQLGLLVPLVLVLTGEWRVIGWAALSALALAGVSALLLFGAAAWPEWYALTRAAQTAMDVGTVGYAKMVSPFAAAMLLGIPAQVSYVVQGAISVTVAAMLAMVCRRRIYTPELGALMLVGAVLATPFVLDYDLLLLAPAMIVIASSPYRSWEKLAVFLAFAAPAFARPLGMNLHLPIVPEIAFFLFWVLWKRLRTSPAPPAPTIERQPNAYTRNIALLIDADNASPANLDAALTILGDLGTVNVRRIYGNWSKPGLKGWSAIVHRYALEPQQQFDLTKGKNATDMKMTIDAMDLLYGGRIKGFGLMTSDSDFMPLAMRIRQNGTPVYGFGTSRTPEAFREACTRFIDLDAVVAVVEEEKKVEKGQPAAKPAAKPEVNEELVKLIGDAWKASKRDENGFSSMLDVGRRVSNRSSFDARSYGFARLSDLIQSLPNFTTEHRDEGLFIKRVR